MSPFTTPNRPLALRCAKALLAKGSWYITHSAHALAICAASGLLRRLGSRVVFVDMDLPLRSQEDTYNDEGRAWPRYAPAQSPYAVNSAGAVTRDDFATTTYTALNAVPFDALPELDDTIPLLSLDGRVGSPRRPRPAFQSLIALNDELRCIAGKTS